MATIPTFNTDSSDKKDIDSHANDQTTDPLSKLKELLPGVVSEFQKHGLVNYLIIF